MYVCMYVYMWSCLFSFSFSVFYSAACNARKVGSCVQFIALTEKLLMLLIKLTILQTTVILCCIKSKHLLTKRHIS